MQGQSVIHLSNLGISSFQVLRPRLAVGIQVWPFANTNGPMTKPLAETLVVKGSGMERAAVVPNGYSWHVSLTSRFVAS